MTALDGIRRDAITHVAELFGFGRRAGPGDDDLAELQRIGGEREVVLDDAGRQRDLLRDRLVAETPRQDAEGLSDRGARAGNDNRVATVVTRGGAETE